MAKPNAKTLRFEERALHLEGPVAAKVRAALKKGRAPILAALGKQIEPSHPPAWLLLATGDLQEVVHLASPLFRAQAQDDDVFYSDLVAEKLVYKGKGKAEQWPKEGDDPTPAKLAPRDLHKADAYDPEGAMPIDGITWIEDPPPSVAAFDKLLDQAREAFNDMAGYDLAEYAPHPEPAAATLAPAAAGSGGMFQGGPGRSGFYSESFASKPKVIWRSSTSAPSGSEWGGSVVVADGMAFGASSGFNCLVAAVNAKTGKALWELKTATTQCWPTTQPLVDRGVLYLGTNHGLHAFEAKSGKLLWLSRQPKLSGAPLVAGEFVLVGSDKGLLALSLANGRKKWALPAKKGVFGALAAAGETIFARIDAKLLALDPAGKTSWKAPTFDYGKCGPLVAEGLVLHSREGNLLAALDAATGRERWTAKIKTELGLGWGHPLSAGAGTVVLVDEKGSIRALELSSGKPRWTYDHKGRSYGIGSWTPVIAGGTVVSAMPDDPNTKTSLLALDLAKGSPLWTIDAFDKDPNFKEQMSWYCTPFVAQGALFIQTHKGILRLE